MEKEDLDNPRTTMKAYGDKLFGFHGAIKLLKFGYRLYRNGWTGGSFLFLQNGHADGLPISKHTAEVTGIEEGRLCVYLPCLMLKTASPTTEFVPWSPTHADLLAEDWLIMW